MPDDIATARAKMVAILREMGDSDVWDLIVRTAKRDQSLSEGTIRSALLDLLSSGEIQIGRDRKLSLAAQSAVA